MEAIPFRGGRYFEWKLLFLVEGIPFSRSLSFKRKQLLYVLVEAIPFSINPSF